MKSYQTEEIPQKERREIKSKLRIVKTEHPTFVISVVVHENSEENKIVRLQCRRLMPMEGYPFESKVVPIGGYVYDGTKDCYLIRCVDYLAIGQMPFSYKIEMDDTGLWSLFVPVPVSIIERNLGTDRKASLKKFRSEYKEESVVFQYVQFVSIC